MTKHRRYFLIGLAASVILLFSLLASFIAAQPAKQDNNATATTLGTSALDEATYDYNLTATALAMTKTRTADEGLAT